MNGREGMWILTVCFLKHVILSWYHTPTLAENTSHSTPSATQTNVSKQGTNDVKKDKVNHTSKQPSTESDLDTWRINRTLIN